MESKFSKFEKLFVVYCKYDYPTMGVRKGCPLRIVGKSSLCDCVKVMTPAGRILDLHKTNYEVL